MNIHSDHEGGLESHSFTSFRAAHSLHHTMSPPHDHDLNPIAERVIGVIDELSRSTKLASGAPIGFWPYVLTNAVTWHNRVGGSVGTSTADQLISPYQRHTLKAPNCMHLPAFGCRVAVLKPRASRLNPAAVATGLAGCGLECRL